MTLSTHLRHVSRDVAPTPPVHVTWREGAVVITGGAVADIADGPRWERDRIELALLALAEGRLPEAASR